MNTPAKMAFGGRGFIGMIASVMVIVMLLGAAPPGASAQALDAALAGPRLYRLSSDATYRNACFEPCDCITDIRGRLAGTMELTPAPLTTPGERRWNVTDVNWKIALADGSEWLARGRGSYSVYSSFGMLTVVSQRMTLDLSINGGPTQRFDSEQVIGGSWAEFPPIRVVIDKNNQVCTDEVLTVVASPVPDHEIVRYCLNRPSSSVEGCFDPCLCPIRLEGALRGTYGLVRLPAPGMDWRAEFAVVRVVWTIIPEYPTPTPFPGTRVTGSGFYTVEPPTFIEGLESMRLALIKGNEPERVWFGARSLFEALQVPPRQINLDLSLNGFYCYDEAFYLRSSRCWFGLDAGDMADAGGVLEDTAKPTAVPDDSDFDR